MSPYRLIPVLLASLYLGLGAVGCRSTSGAFQMDSNSRLPWFGLNLSLPQPSAQRKTLQTISNAAPESAGVNLADERRVETAASEPVTAVAKNRTLQPASPPPAHSRGLLSRLVGGEQSLPLPATAQSSGGDGTISLIGPREEFR